MSYGLSSTLGIVGLFFIIIGIIMAIVGIILLITNQNQVQPWYVWFLLVGGVILGIIGGIMLAVAYAGTPEVKQCPRPCPNPCEPEYEYIEMYEQQPPKRTVQKVPKAPKPVPAPVVYQQPIQYQQPVIQYQPAPVMAPQPQRLPPREVTTYVSQAGPAHFNPDPYVVEKVQPGRQVRTVRAGPHGPGYENLQLPGTLTEASTVETTVIDVGDYEVQQ
jgi:hypothetical protein